MEAGYRHLTSDEVSVLKAQGCWAEDWQLVHVSENFAPYNIVRVNFYGIVRIGELKGSIALPGGVSIASGIYDATLFNVTVGDGSLITNVHGYIANYDIGSRTYIADVGKIYMEGISSFGNGTRINVLNETGGREVAMYEGMSAQTAYFSAMYRHRPDLVAGLAGMADSYASAVASDRGRIGAGVKVENVGMIRNVRIGDNAVVQGCLRLFDGTVASTQDAPVLIGSGVICTDFIVQSGSVVEDGAVVTRTFVGQGVTLAKGFSCSDSLFFANSHCENGEAVSVFAGPFTVSHHKSTLLIGSMFSFMNAGSSTNFSNHLYKLGPVHQGVFGRGVKCGSGSYMMLPVRVAPFTTVLGHHTERIDIPDMPFSYIIESGGTSCLIPGVNLRSIGLFRDIRKWPARDRRSLSGRIDNIRFEAFSPYTAGAMLSGRDQLVRMLSEERFSGTPSSYGGCTIPGTSLTSGVERYETALKYYIGLQVALRLRGRRLGSDEAIASALHPVSPVGDGCWVDIAGLLAPKAEIDQLVEEISSGSLDSPQAVESRLSAIASNYPLYEWRWIYSNIQTVFNTDPKKINRKKLIELLRQWGAASESLFADIESDASKEFGDAMMTGFAVDGVTREEILADFRNVRGDFDSDPQITAVREARQRTAGLAGEILSAL